jgi:hypothetical protein
MSGNSDSDGFLPNAQSKQAPNKRATNLTSPKPNSSKKKKHQANPIYSNNLPPFTTTKLPDKPLRKKIDINDPQYKTQRMLLNTVIRAAVLIGSLMLILSAKKIFHFLTPYLGFLISAITKYLPKYT